jgi:serine phosphatase RsbU (regulator of sigma subunit)
MDDNLAFLAANVESLDDALMAKMHDFMQGAAAVDDMTLMVIKVVSRSAPGEPAPPS